MLHTRRGFLKASLGASALLSFGLPVPAFLRGAAQAGVPRPDAEGRILVAVQLSGGNDGLNTVVPFGDDAYARSRRVLRLRPEQVHKIDSSTGFHPELAAFLELYQEGHLSVVQGVGYPKSSRDHDDAMLDWHKAKPGEPGCQTGWLGRAADHIAGPGQVVAGPGQTLSGPGQAIAPAAFAGEIEQPFSLNAERTIIPTIRSLRGCTFDALLGPEGDPKGSPKGGEAHLRRLGQLAELPRGPAGGPFLEFLQRSARAAHAASRRVEAVAKAAAVAEAGATGYPPFQLAGTLGIVAQLIRAEIGARIYFTELGGGGIGGFDTHANQAANHGALLRQLSQSILAFVKDLKRDGLLDRVLIMTFSEFGRTVSENGRRGTDHGAAAPLFLAGGKLKGGLAGPHPSLTDLEGDGLKFHTDFRRVYATVLDRWLGVESEPILGERFEPVDVLVA